VLAKDENFQIVLNQFPLCNLQNVLFETLRKIYIYNINFLNCKR